MRNLIALISTEGKSPEQIKKETVLAFQKYQEVKSQVEKQLKETQKEVRSQIVFIPKFVPKK
ncbi:MAG TPA: hypothetical protein VJC13_03205 [Candidatus Paceibacterota bacterium]